MENLAGVEWDQGNLTKCQRHGVSIEEIEQLFAGTPRYSPDQVHSGHEQRFLAIGHTTEGRALYVVFTLRDHQGGLWVRPISARYMHDKEARRYNLAKSARPQN